MSAPNTRQGVRDLNGPLLNGRHYNGRAIVSCPHFRALDFPTYRVEEVREVIDPDLGTRDFRMVGITKCTNCDQERWTDAEET